MKTCSSVSYVIIRVRATSGGVTMGFLNDELWNNAKLVVKKQGMGDNWIEVMDYYYHIGGCHVLVYALINDIAYRILRVTDMEDVLLIDKNGDLIVRSYGEVLESRKQFFFSEKPLVKEAMKLPDGCEISGASELKIYV